MQCETIQEQISRLLDHELSIEEAQSVFSHLGGCAACTVFYRHTALIGKRLRQGGDAVYPHALDARIHDAVDAHLGARRRASGYLPDTLRTFARRRLVLPIPVAVAVLIVSLGISILLLRNFAPAFLPVEKETKIVVAYPAVEVVADQSVAD
jgi:anti-sigma factor RsiW